MDASVSLWKAAILLAALACQTMGQESAPEQGPAGFMWPPDRVWSAAMDNTAPCGSADGVKSRTEFPLTGGAVALIAQDDSYSAQLSISFQDDPKTQNDFTFVTNPAPFREIDPGHSCFHLPDPPARISSGQVATIQLKYTADFDRPENQTFYACADIIYVLPENFDIPIPCFNATNSTHDIPAPTATGIPTELPGHGDDGPPLVPVTGDKNEGSGSGSGGGLSKGAIAGAVIGSVVGLGLIVGLGLFLYRERQKTKRLERQRDSGRGVKWVEDPDATTTRDGASSRASAGESLRMGSMSGGAGSTPTATGN
ncbi:hypothetical protein V8F33_005784 [Rhypophila sp. PSN 637]